jgi:hypothetical protein
MAIPINAFFVVQRFVKRLAQSNTDIFYGMVRIDMQIAYRFNFQVNQSMPRDLIQHVLQKGDAKF